MHFQTKAELIRKIGIFGLSDLRKLAPIGDIGYANGWYPPFFRKPTWADTEMPKAIYEAAYEQGFKFEVSAITTGAQTPTTTARSWDSITT